MAPRSIRGSQPKPHLTTLDLKDIKELIALMRKNDLSVFKLEQEGFKVTLKRGSDPVITVPSVVASAAPPGQAAPVYPGNAAAPPAGNEKLKDITSPMVGTFYTSPSPDSQAFVKTG